MDADRFDALSRSLFALGSRRRTLGGLVVGTLGLLSWRSGDDSAAHDLSQKCKKKSGKQKKKCLKKAKQHAATHATACVPTCAATNACGPDGCGGSCGSCTGGTCTGGTCVCPSGMDFCGGACRSACNSVSVRNPFTCTCCQYRERCGPTNHTCCSGVCAFGADPSHPTEDWCRQRLPGESCDFGAQCRGDNPRVPGTCSNGVCAAWSVGIACTQDAQCGSGQCGCVGSNCTCRKGTCGGSTAPCNPNDPAGRDADCCEGSCTACNINSGQCVCQAT